MPTDKEIKLRRRMLRQFAKGYDVNSLLAATPKTQRSRFELIEDLDLQFNNLVLLGFCEWRHLLSDPRNLLDQAYRLAVRASELVSKSWTASETVPFWFPPSVYISRLLTGSFDERLLGMLPDFQTWMSVEIVTTAYLDMGHIMAMLGGDYPHDWEDMISAVQRNPEAGLLIESHRCYRNLIEQRFGGSEDQLGGLIREAVEKFEGRDEDPFYAESMQIEGGEPSNQFTVDYRLAVIVEHCYSARRDELPPSVIDHLWPPTPLKGKSRPAPTGPTLLGCVHFPRASPRLLELAFQARSRDAAGLYRSFDV